MSRQFDFSNSKFDDFKTNIMKLSQCEYRTVTFSSKVDDMEICFNMEEILIALIYSLIHLLEGRFDKIINRKSSLIIDFTSDERNISVFKQGLTKRCLDENLYLVLNEEQLEFIINYIICLLVQDKNIDYGRNNIVINTALLQKLYIINKCYLVAPGELTKVELKKILKTSYEEIELDFSKDYIEERDNTYVKYLTLSPKLNDLKSKIRFAILSITEWADINNNALIHTLVRDVPKDVFYKVYILLGKDSKKRISDANKSLLELMESGEIITTPNARERAIKVNKTIDKIVNDSCYAVADYLTKNYKSVLKDTFGVTNYYNDEYYDDTDDEDWEGPEDDNIEYI